MSVKVKTMGEHLRRFFSGFGQVLVISPNRAYVRPSKAGFKADVIKLRRDVKTIGKDIKKKLSQSSYGKSSDYR